MGDDIGVPGEEIRTLFVSGLPHDVTDREMRLLFRSCPGFEFANIRGQGGKTPVCFAGFVDQASAIAARDNAQGYQFDLQSSVTVRVELAKQNSRKRAGPGDAPPPPSKRVFSQPEASAMFDPYAGAFAPGFDAGMYGNAPNWGGSAVQYGQLGTMGDPFSHVQASAMSGGLGGGGHHGGARAANPPGTTLFVANIEARGGKSETEIRQLFEGQRGYIHLKMQEMRGLPVAFVEFKEPSAASAAMQALQGHIPSGSASAIRIEFAKSKMRSAGPPQQY